MRTSLTAYSHRLMSDTAAVDDLFQETMLIARSHQSGQGGIRTHGTHKAYTAFPVPLLQPLGHLSQESLES